MKAVSCVALLTFGATIAQPTVAVVRADAQKPVPSVPRARSVVQQIGDLYIELETLLERMDRRLDGKYEFDWQNVAARSTPMPAPGTAAREDLRELQAQLDGIASRLQALQKTANGYFDATGDSLRERRAPAAAIDRLQATASVYRGRHEALTAKLDAVRNATSAAGYRSAVADAHAFLERHSSRPLRASHDPQKLAFGPSRQLARKPIADAAELRRALGAESVLNATSPPGPSSLAATEDVQLTPDILAKANALGRQPLPIYQWVRNNVKFAPTYGSIQGSDYVLKTLEGNAYDQASLLIALLRASGINARYAYGTVEVPIAQVKNWLGNVTTAEAALQLLGQGGVPAVGIVQGGTITHVQMEHVWVEAYVDYIPSRGARHVAGDTWIAMDPSFKQFDYLAPIKPSDAATLDMSQYVATLQSSGEVDATAGWARNLAHDASNAQVGNALTAYRNFLDVEDAQLSEITGGRAVRVQTATYLAATLPYTLNSVANRWSELPASLRWSFEYRIDGTTLLSRGLPALAGSQIAVSFEPASAADADLLRSYLPGTVDDLGDLPDAVPAGDANLRPVLAVNRTAVASAPARALGEELIATLRLHRPGQGWSQSQKTLIAGDYQAVKLDLGVLAAADFDRVKADSEFLGDKIAGQDYTGLDTHLVGGIPLQGVLLSYFAHIDNVSRMLGGWTDTVFQRLPSYGSVSSTSVVTKWMGIPIDYSPQGLTLDIDHLSHAAVDRANDLDRTRIFNRNAGALASTYEHLVLQWGLAKSGETPQATSAVKLLAAAQASGQRVFHVTNANLQTALNAMTLPASVETRIAEFVNAGYTVDAHESTVSFGGTTSAGYVAIDPTTGAGAYLIASDANGGYVDRTGMFYAGVAAGALLMALMAGAFLAAPVIGLGAVLAIGATLALFALITAIMAANPIACDGNGECGPAPDDPGPDAEMRKACFIKGLMSGIAGAATILGTATPLGQGFTAFLLLVGLVDLFAFGAVDDPPYGDCFETPSNPSLASLRTDGTRTCKLASAVAPTSPGREVAMVL
ncbi:MAG TPA: transglutaminase domain-containing protein [Tahibacter sp.]|nr:transglutaminase domain-containing protein [Tahibacter sp.]